MFHTGISKSEAFIITQRLIVNDALLSKFGLRSDVVSLSSWSARGYSAAVRPHLHAAQARGHGRNVGRLPSPRGVLCHDRFTRLRQPVPLGAHHSVRGQFFCSANNNGQRGGGGKDELEKEKSTPAHGEDVSGGTGSGQLPTVANDEEGEAEANRKKEKEKPTERRSDFPPRPIGFERFFPSDMQQYWVELESAKENVHSSKEGEKSEHRARRSTSGRIDIPMGPVLLLTLLLGSGAVRRIRDVMYPSVTQQDFFRDYLEAGVVQSVEVDSTMATAVVRSPGGTSTTVKFSISSPEAFERKLDEYQSGLDIAPNARVPTTFVGTTSYSPWFFGALALLGLGSVLLAGMSAVGQVQSRMRSITTTKDAIIPVQKKTKFVDVAGMANAKMEVKEFVDFLKNRAKYEQLGATLPKGALLSGSPGTGKTLLAKAVAGEAAVPFFALSGSDFMELYVGVGAARVRDLFAKARKAAPSIIWIDEIDAIGRKRSANSARSHDERDSTLNQLLVEMDGFTTKTGVVVLAGTNRPDILDSALVRPGRLDRTIHIEKPDLNERREIFGVHMKPLKLNASSAFDTVCHRMAALTPGMVGADIRNLCNEAAICAARRGGDSVTTRDFDTAVDRVLAGLPATRVLTPKIKHAVCIHEAGHVVVGWYLEHSEPVLKVTAVPRSSGALGFAQQMPADVKLLPKASLEDKIAMCLGGRASEELFLDDISTGAMNDFEQATSIAQLYVARCGMNEKLGLVSYKASEEYRPAEETIRMIDIEVKDMLALQYGRAKAVLTEHKDKLLLLADRLYDKETLTRDEIEECLGPRPFEIDGDLAEYLSAVRNT